MSRKHKTEKPNETQPSFFARRRVLLALGAVAVVGGGGGMFLMPAPSMAEEVVVYKDPSCECCGRWVDHMRSNGFSVAVSNVEDMDTVKRQAGIPEAMASCHTAYVGDYLVEGHVPAADIKRMLADRPSIKGLAVPGMPASAPGMDSPGEPFTVLAFSTSGMTRVFATY